MMKFFIILYRSLSDFLKDNGFMLAASLSYFTVMAIVPFSIFLIAIFANILGHYPEFNRFLMSKLMELFPAVTKEITRDISRLALHSGLGKINLFFYGFLSYQMFASIENSMDVIFKIKKKRPFIISILVSLFFVTLIMALLTASFLATSIIPMLKVIGSYLPVIKISKLAQFIIRFVIPFILIFFTVSIMYFLIPRVRIKLKSALAGAFFTTIFLEIAKHIFTWYVSEIASLGKLYGPLSAFVIFLLWIFYSSCIFLLGAEIVHKTGGTFRIKGERQ